MDDAQGKGIGRTWAWKEIARNERGEWYVCAVADDGQPLPLTTSTRVVPGGALKGFGFREVIGDDDALSAALIGTPRTAQAATVTSAPKGAESKEASEMWESAAKKKTSAPTPATSQATKPDIKRILQAGDELMVAVSRTCGELLDTGPLSVVELDYENATYNTFEEIRAARHEECFDDDEDEDEKE